MRILRAEIMSDAMVLPAEIMSGQIVTVHNDYVNMSTPAGLIALVRAGMAHIPFGIEVVLDGDWRNAGFEINQPVCYCEESLVIGETLAVAGLKCCPRFSCRPVFTGEPYEEVLQFRLKELHNLCMKSCKTGGILPYLYPNEVIRHSLDGMGVPAVPKRLGPLIAGIIQRNNTLLAEGVVNFLGLGPGSTPSGDDFLLGFLCGLTYVRYEKYAGSIKELAQLMVVNAGTLTTRMSAEYIKYGTKGLYHQRFSEMISVFRTGTEQDLYTKAQALLGLGHFSGTDLLLGFIYGGFTALAAGATVDGMGGSQ